MPFIEGRTKRGAGHVIRLGNKWAARVPRASTGIPYRGESQHTSRRSSIGVISSVNMSLSRALTTSPSLS